MLGSMNSMLALTDAQKIALAIGLVILGLVFFVLALLLVKFFRLWLQARFSDARVKFSELIGMWILAIMRNLNLREVMNLILPYPTLSEIGKRAAIDYFLPSLTGVWARRIIRWMRIFG